MTVLLPPHFPPMNPAKRVRRTATAVMAGAFDIRPPRDVLTSLLNGVGPYKAVEKEEESRRNRKREKRDRDRERKREKAAQAKQQAQIGQSVSAPPTATRAPQTAFAGPSAQPAASSAKASSYWHVRPAIHIATMQRSVSVTPPPSTSPVALPSTPASSTPGPSHSSWTSRTSSKRPHTPADGEDLSTKSEETRVPTPPPLPRPRKKRVAVKKGWKGWVEGSPPPSEKLINLDAVPILHERRTRSGKNFDAIGVGKDGWV